MVRVANPYKLEPYKHESFEPDEAWFLRASKSDDDDELVEALVRTYVVKDVNMEEVEAARLKGKNTVDVISKFVEPEVHMSMKRATLLHMTHHWTLRYPDDHTTAELDAAGQPVLNEDGTIKLIPHPQAGEIMPVNAESIGELAGISDDAYWHMNELWAADGRTEKQEATFSKRGMGLGGESRSGRAKGVSKSATGD